MNFIVYEPASGRIVSLGFAANEGQAAMQAGPGLGVLVGGYGLDTTHYVQDGAVAERPAIALVTVSLPIGEQPVSVSPPLPAGSAATTGGGPALMNDAGEVLHIPTSAGAWTYEISPPWPWQPGTITVIVES